MSDATDTELKVAKAIFLTKPQHPQACFDDMPSIMANHYFDQARAAIKAMNIPALLTETRTKALSEKEAEIVLLRDALTRARDRFQRIHERHVYHKEHERADVVHDYFFDCDQTLKESALKAEGGEI